jgi:tetratricopeptide (TPR) repeat protein
MPDSQDNETIDPNHGEEGLEGDDDGGLMIEEPNDAEMAAAEEAAESEIMAAAKQVDLVVLPLACVNEGLGAPLSMGVQRWWAQELTQDNLRAAAPVFTAMAEQEGRKVPALMVHRDPWTDERAREGMSRFPNAKRGVVSTFHVSEQSIKLDVRLFEISGETLSTVEEWHVECDATTFPQKLFDITAQLAARTGHTSDETSWEGHFGTKNQQAVISFLVGLGNLSALQGRCVPASSEQLLTPLIDALNRDASMELAMDALHAMVDTLLAIQPDRATLPLCLQALTVAAQKREKDIQAWHHLAVVASQVGDLPLAVNAFNQAFNLDPTHAIVSNNFIQTLRRANDNENALKVAQFAVERGNDHPGVLAHMGALLIDADRFDEAEPFLRRAVEEGKVASAFGDLANVLWERAPAGSAARKEDQEEAMRLLEEAIGRPAIAKSTLDVLLDLHEEEGLEDATKLLLAAVEKHPKSAAVRTAVANLYLEGDNPAQAKPHLEAILALPRRSLDDDAFARRNLLALSIENFDEKYDAAVEGAKSKSAKDRSDAARFLREVIAADARFWQPHLMLALAVREDEGESSALAHLQNAAQLRPNEASVHEMIAMVYRKLGQPKQAIEHLRTLVSLKPREVSPVLALATCMRDANQFDDARSVCEAALRMVPDHAEFKKILASLPAPKH